MEDLDLDELDQAVSQLMDQPKKSAARKPALKPAEPRATAAEPTSAPAPSDTPAEAPREPVSVTRSAPATASRPMPNLPSRSRTRPGAMDIISPRPAQPAPSQRASRMASSLQPRAPITPDPIVPQPAPVATHDEVGDDLLASLNMNEDRSKMSQPALTAPTNHEAWPDPLDVHGFGQQPEAPAEPAALAPQTPEPEPTPVEPTPAPTEPQPELADAPTLETQPSPETSPSPFLTTKVEKRPLGAYTNAEPPGAAPEMPVELPSPAPQTSVEPPIPPQETSKADMAEASLQSAQHLQPQPEPDHSPDMNDLRTMAIPQQYHTPQPTPSDAVRNVFDTKEYHAAPQPMRTAHSGGPWLVIGIVVLIVLIIAVALVGYLMMTDMVDFSNVF